VGLSIFRAYLFITCRILEVFGERIIEDLEETPGFPSSHANIVIKIVTTLFRGGSRKGAIEFCYPVKEVSNQRQNLSTGKGPLENHIKTSATSHGPKVDRFGPPYRMVS